MPVESSRADPFVVWLAHNMENIRKGDGNLNGFAITPETTVRQYRTTLSCLIVTVDRPSRLYVDGYDNCALASLRCSLPSLLLGWWGFPWGPILTVSSLFGNLLGGSKVTVANLIDEITGHRQTVVELTERGAELARQKIAEQGYPPETALLVRVTHDSPPTYQVQFDLPESDGRQWRSESHGVTLLVDKEAKEKLVGLTIDADDGEFSFRR